MNSHDTNASLVHDVRQKLRQWQYENPDWEEIANKHPSQIRDERVRRRRQQICEGIAELTLAAIQRRANESRLPAEMSHGEKFIRSEATTMAQHAAGIRIPFEHQLAELYEFIDGHTGHLGTDVVATVQSWVKTNIAQPVRDTFGRDGRPRR